MNKPTIKGVYLIQEKGCLNPYSGAFQHISMGIHELSQHFNISTYESNRRIDISSIKKGTSNKESISSSVVKNYFYGTIKDIFILFKNLKSIPRLIKLFKEEHIAFVYERASYLNFSGVIACRYLGIPHFYEANGLQFESRKKYYNSLFYKITKNLEKLSYQYASHTFFVGSYGDYWKIKKCNWSNVENGIESIRILNAKKTEDNSGIIDVCFVGRFMKHQRLDVLVKGLEIFENKSLLRINLIGTGLDKIEEEIKELGIDVVNHGFVSRDDIENLVHKFQIAVIAGSPEFQSCMKLFDYGAAGCAVIAPSIHNLNYWFPEELLFFDGTPADLANKLNDLIEENSIRKVYGLKLHNKVKSQFTWDKIFNKKANIMKGILNEKTR
jgi:glycosyltransferase involved in cell wall biosynthesis